MLLPRVNSKEDVIPLNAIFRVRTKQYQMERWLKAENGEQLNSDGLGSLKVGDRKSHALTLEVTTGPNSASAISADCAPAEIRPNLV